MKLLTGVRVPRLLDTFVGDQYVEITDRRAGSKVFVFCCISFTQYLVRVLSVFDADLMQIAMPRAGSKGF